MHHVDIRSVRMFVALAEDLSFRRAAERLRVAQPWLSVQIRKLEEQLGFRLLDRDRNRLVALTPEGCAFLPAARAYVRAGEEAMFAAQSIRRGSRAILRIGAPEFSAGIPARDRLIHAFTAKHPEIDVEVVNAFSVTLLEMMQASTIDIAFTIGHTQIDECDKMQLCRYRWAMLVPQGSRWDAHAELPLSAFTGVPVALFRRKINPSLYDNLARTFDRAGIPVVTLTEASSAGLHNHVERTAMPVLVGEWHGHDRPLPPGIRLVMLVGAVPQFKLDIVRRTADDRREVAAFWNLAAEYADEDVDKEFFSTFAE